MARYSRRKLMRLAGRAGLGIATIALAGCASPEVYNSRDGQPADEERPPSPVDSDQDQQAAIQAAAQAAALAAERRPGTAMQRLAVASGGEVRDCTRPSLQSAGDAHNWLTETVDRVIADPAVWRERYHWRTLPVTQNAAPGADVLTLGSAPIAMQSWQPLLCSQLIVLGAGDGVDAHRAVVEGDLAASWEMPDSATIVFNLHRNVRWPDRDGDDGRPLTASDVVAAHEEHRSAGQPRSAVYRAVASIAADDVAGTVTFTLSEPDASLLLAMTDAGHAITPPGWSLTAGEPPLGTGPFRVEQWGMPGTPWRLARSPGYFKRDESGRPLPYLNGIRGGLPPDDDSRPECSLPLDAWGQWLDGRVDATALRHPGEVLYSLNNIAGTAAQVAAPMPGQGSVLEFPRNVEQPITDPRVRRAISMALDRTLLAEQLADGLAAPDCGMNWMLEEDEQGGFREWPWTEEELGLPYQQDPQAVQELLAAAGYSPRLPLRLSMLPVSLEESLRSHLGFVRVGRLSSMLSTASTGVIRLNPLTSMIHADEYKLHFNSETGRSFLAAQEANLALSDSSAMHPATCDPTTLVPLPDVQHRQDTEDARVAELWQQQRRTIDPVERSQVLEQLRLRRSEMMETVHMINRYGPFARRANVHNVVITAFAHDPMQQAKQLERAWKSGEGQGA